MQPDPRWIVPCDSTDGWSLLSEVGIIRQSAGGCGRNGLASGCRGSGPAQAGQVGEQPVVAQEVLQIGVAEEVL